MTVEPPGGGTRIAGQRSDLTALAAIQGVVEQAEQLVLPAEQAGETRLREVAFPDAEA